MSELKITVAAKQLTGFAAGDDVHFFPAVRYAKLQRGRRFGPAVEVTDAADTAQDLRDRPAVFPQLPSRLGVAMGRDIEMHPQEEDAFLLNIWAPSGAHDLPVLFFIHGGAFQSGAGTARWYDGRRLAALGMIVVTVNYRLGALGHLVTGTADEDGNRPLRDLLCALTWVQNNIRVVGGDPASVTVAGHSAGGNYAQLLAALPEARGLLNRAWLMSAADLKFPDRAQALALGANALGRDPYEASVADLLAAQLRVLTPPSLGRVPLGFTPVRDGLIPARWGDPACFAADAHVSDVLVTHTTDEMGVFYFSSQLHIGVSHADACELAQSVGRADLASSNLDPYDIVVAASTWDFVVRGARATVSELVKAGVPSSLVEFTQPSPLGRMGAGHCFDLPFLFGDREAWRDAPMLRGVDERTFEATGLAWRTMAASFVLNGLSDESRHS